MPQPFDRYSFLARVVPVALVALPPLLLVGAGIVSGARLGVASGIVLTVLGAVAGQLGRDRGKRLEGALWQGWGGSPTLRRLRFRDAADPAAVARLHKRIEAVLDDPMPTSAEEESDPAAADAHYEDVTKRLRGLTRDHEKFAVLFAENVNYGQRRNLLGLRPVGLAVAAATAVLSLALLAFSGGSLGARSAGYGPGLAVALLELAFWWRIVSERWVRIPAEACADRLFESVDTLRQAGS